MAQRRVKAQLWDISQTKGEGLYLLMLNESSRLLIYVFLFAFLPSFISICRPDRDMFLRAMVWYLRLHLFLARLLGAYS